LIDDLERRKAEDKTERSCYCTQLNKSKFEGGSLDDEEDDFGTSGMFVV
jgi:hypothetical protein